MHISLTEEQEIVIAKCLKSISKESITVLKGSAGVGKTTSLKELLNRYVKTNPFSTIGVCGPTHQAVKVLKNKIGINSDYVYGTVHSVLKLRLQRNSKGVLKTVTTLGTPNAISKLSLLVVDEGSQIETDLYDLIELTGLPVLYVGDSKQTFPVNESMSKVFTEDLATFELTEIIRQKKDNPIIELSHNLDMLNTPSNKGTETEGYIYTANEPKIVETLAEDDNAVYIGWTNATVNRMNNSVRLHKYGANALDYCPNERVLFSAPYLDYNNGDYITVRSIGEEQINVIVEGMNLVFDVNVINGNIVTLKKGNDENRYNLVLKKLYASAKRGKTPWNIYDEYANKFAKISYSYAITVHKSQGSEWETVIVNIRDIKNNVTALERNALLYTAITRAKKLLILYGCTR